MQSSLRQAETSVTRRETSRETSVKSFSQECLSAEQAKTSGHVCVSRVGQDKWETSATRRETSRETSGDRCGKAEEHSRGPEDPERPGRQGGRVRDKCKIDHAAECAGDEWGTSVNSRGPKSCGQSAQSVLETRR